MDKQAAEEYAEIRKILKENAEQSRQTDRKLAELAEQSKQTDRKLAELAEQSKQTDRKLAELAESIQETRRELTESAEKTRQAIAESSKETDRKLAESSKKLAESAEKTRQAIAERSRETDRKLAESSKKLAESAAETRRELAEQSREARRERVEQSKQAAQERAEIREELRKTIRWLQESNKKLEGFGLVQGEIAEDLFIRTVEDAMRLQNIDISAVYPYPRIKGVCEYDLLAVNGNEVFVFEIKNKLRAADLEKFCGVQLPRFKQYFPQYEHHTLYGGVGALVVKDQLEARARNLGLYVLKQGGKDNSVLHKPPKPRAF